MGAGDTYADQTSPWPKWVTADFTKWFAKIVVTALIAGITASFGFWSTWQGLMAQVSENTRQIKAQGSHIDALEQRQDLDERTAAATEATNRAILDRLNELRDDVKYLQRDLTGRVRP